MLYNFLLKLRHKEFFGNKWNELKEHLSGMISYLSQSLHEQKIKPEIKEFWKIKIAYYESLLNSIMKLEKQQNQKQQKKNR